MDSVSLKQIPKFSGERKGGHKAKDCPQRNKIKCEHCGPKGQTRTKVEVVALIGDNQEVQSCSLKRRKALHSLVNESDSCLCIERS